MISVTRKVETVEEKQFDFGGTGGLTKFDKALLERSGRVTELNIKDENGDVLLFDTAPTGVLGLVVPEGDKFRIVQGAIFYQETEKSLRVTVQMPDFSVVGILVTRGGSLQVGGKWIKDIGSPWVVGGYHHDAQYSVPKAEGEVPELLRKERNAAVSYVNAIAYAELAKREYANSVEIDHAAMGLTYNPNPTAVIEDSSSDAPPAEGAPAGETTETGDTSSTETSESSKSKSAAGKEPVTV